jgi:membrane-associated phospholipid phosphatase
MTRASETVREGSALDRAVYAAIATVPTPLLDRGLGRLSRAADRSVLWLGISGVLATAGGARGRRAARQGVLAIGVSSAVVNLAVKPLARRERPDRAGMAVPLARHVPMPLSRSFPSGHSASAFAFATAAGHELPLAGPPLRALAALVAYSRVHTGVHYPGDAVAGSLIGGTVGGTIAALRSAAVRRSAAR